MNIKWLKDRLKRNDLDETEEFALKKCAVYYIPCDKIRPNALRSRSDFDEDKLVTLAYSIKKYGIIEPLCVRTADEDDTYDYELIYGERRLRAARLAELSAVPCVVVDMSAEFSAEISLIENTFRSDLDYFESAFALKRLVDASGESFEALACRLNISQEDILKKLHLLGLSVEERQILLENRVGEELAVEIARISNDSCRAEILELISQSSAPESDIAMRVRSCRSDFSRGTVRELPRDVSAIIKGIKRKVELFDRSGRRSEIKVSNDGDSVSINVRIKR